MLKDILALFLLTLIIAPVHAQRDADQPARLRISASGGYAFRLGKKLKTDPYFNEISKGGTFNTDLTYYFSENGGIGLKYAYFSAAGSSYRLSPSVISNITINYWGPMYQARITGLTGRFSFVSGVSLGYMSYQDKGWVDHQYGVMKGGSLGTLLEVGVDLKLFKGLGFGLNTSLYGGSLSSVTRQGQTIKLDDKQRESLSRFEATAGLRYSFR